MPNKLSGLKIEFEYPTAFDTVSQVKNDPLAVEQYNISSQKSYERSITVNVRPLPSGQLDEDSSYRFRALNTAEYRPKVEQVSGTPAVVMAKMGDGEQTLFWPSQGHVVTISVTSSHPQDDVVAIMNTVRSTLRWRR